MRPTPVLLSGLAVPGLAASATALAGEVGLDVLIGAATGRPELDPPAAARWGWLVPELTVRGAVARGGVVEWALATGSRHSAEVGWGIGASVAWRPRRAIAAAPGPYGEDYDSDGQIVADPVPPDPPTSAVGRAAAGYGRELASAVAALYGERSAILGHAPGASLADGVARELRLQELDARLNALCPGAFPEASHPPIEASR